MSITSANVLQRNLDLVCTKLDDSALVLGAELQNYYAMQGAGAHIWDKLETPTTYENLVKQLAAKYSLNQEANQEIQSFLTDCLNAKLIHIVDESTESGMDALPLNVAALGAWQTPALLACAVQSGAGGGSDGLTGS